MKVTLLGTGSPVPSLKRASAGYMVQTGDNVVLIDHGPGTFQRMMEAGVSPTQVSHVVFSHIHFDHCLDFVRLFLHRWDISPPGTRKLQVFGPPGLKHFVERLFGEDGAFKFDLTARTNHENSLDIYQKRGGTPPRPRPEADITEVAESDVIKGAGWQIKLSNVPHHQPYLVSYGVRFESDGGVFTYSSDITVPVEKLPAKPMYDLAKDADVLVHYLNSFDVSREETPQDLNATPQRTVQQALGELARDCNVKTLVTTHHGPLIDTDGIRERVIADIAAVYKGRLIWGEDLMEFDI
jgi:ribonuclease BN (tRNA processing enzyme)